MDNSSKDGTHWRSILDIDPKTDIFFFDTFRTFIIQDAQKLIEKTLFGVE